MDPVHRFHVGLKASFHVLDLVGRADQVPLEAVDLPVGDGAAALVLQKDVVHGLAAVVESLDAPSPRCGVRSGNGAEGLQRRVVEPDGVVPAHLEAQRVLAHPQRIVEDRLEARLAELAGRTDVVRLVRAVVSHEGHQRPEEFPHDGLGLDLLLPGDQLAALLDPGAVLLADRGQVRVDGVEPDGRPGPAVDGAPPLLEAEERSRLALAEGREPIGRALVRHQQGAPALQDRPHGHREVEVACVGAELLPTLAAAPQEQSLVNRNGDLVWVLFWEERARQRDELKSLAVTVEGNLGLVGLQRPAEASGAARHCV